MDLIPNFLKFAGAQICFFKAWGIQENVIFLNKNLQVTKIVHIFAAELVYTGSKTLLEIIEKRYASSCVLKPAKFQKDITRWHRVLLTCNSVGLCHYIFYVGFSQDLRTEIGDNSLTLLSHMY